MRNTKARLVGVGCVLVVAAQAAAQSGSRTNLFGLRGNGDVVWIDLVSGAGVQSGSSGIAVNGARGFRAEGGRLGCWEGIYVVGGPGPTANQLTTISSTGHVGQTYPLTGLPAGYVIRAMAGEYYVLGSLEPAGVDLLGMGSPSNLAEIVVIGPTGRSDLEGLALSAGGVLFALGTGGGGTLCTLDMSTGAATVIASGGFGEDTTALEFLPDGRLLAAGANLREVNPATGATTLIGPTGFDDIHALAVIHYFCYPNCECAGPPPVLNVADFSCFLTRYALGDPYANCDGSTVQPALNVADFTCFLQKFWAGCP